MGMDELQIGAGDSVQDSKSDKTKYVSDGGATSSHREPDYSLLIPEALRAFIRRRELGARLHGRDNWKQGNAAFVAERRLHLFNHALGLVTGDSSDDHLGGVLCNASFLAYFEQQPATVELTVKEKVEPWFKDNGAGGGCPVCDAAVCYDRQHEALTTAARTLQTSHTQELHQRAVAQLKGACAFAHGFPRDTQHGYTGKNKVAWEYGYDYANNYCDRKETKCGFAGKSFPYREVD